MKLAHILERKGSFVHTIHAQETVLEAVKKLNTHNIGALVVVNSEKQPVGIITERDILRLTGQHPTNLANEVIEKHMTRELVVGECETPLEDAMAAMSEHRIRHLPVIRKGKLEGMVSQGDLVKAMLDDAQFETRQLTAFVMGKYPA